MKVQNVQNKNVFLSFTNLLATDLVLVVGENCGQRLSTKTQ